MQNNSTYYHPLDLVAHLPSNYSFQEFSYFLVIDFEATCDKDKAPYPQEIIEFPAVLINSSTVKIEDSFHTYVRPTYHPQLTDFCKELTGIQQDQIDNGLLFSDALLKFDNWLEKKGIKNENFAIVTWTNWDCRVMLDFECTFKGIPKPSYFNRWINLKVPFQEMYGKFPNNLKESVHHAGLTWYGRAHSGLDDAQNTARLLIRIMVHGFHFSITNTIERPFCAAYSSSSAGYFPRTTQDHGNRDVNPGLNGH